MIGRTITPEKQTFSPLRNYYGGVSVITFEGRHFLALGNVDRSRCVEVSEAFHRAFLAEFEALGVGFQDEDVEYVVTGGAQ